MQKVYDLIVIGTGSAGTSVATACREAGWSVAIADRLPFGGTCALRGCDPKKVLVEAAAAVDTARALATRGVHAESLRIAWPDLQRFKRTFTDPVTPAREKVYAERGIDTYYGPARFIDSETLDLAGVRCKARHIVIATGSRPAVLQMPGARHMVTSDAFLDLETLPSSIVFVGGGYISMEFAHVAARAGARVTVLHRGARPLEGFDPDLVDCLAAATHDIGIDLRLKVDVQAIELRDEGGYDVVVNADDETSRTRADLVVHGAGRTPDIDDLDLAAGGVRRVRHGIEVNEHLQSVSNPRVFAAGDAAASGLPMLTPVASHDARLVAANLLEGLEAAVTHVPVPSVCFTLPAIARVGLLEADARSQGMKLRVKHESTAGWSSSRRVNESYSAYKTIVDAESDRVLGAHLLGPHAEETINLFTLAMRQRTTATELREVLWAYPTQASDLAYML